MLKKLLIALLSFLPCTAFASTQVILTNGTNISTSAVSYSGVGVQSSYAVDRSTFSVRAPGSGIYSNLYANVTTAPGVGASWVITLHDNAADTALTCTISGTNTSCSDKTHNVSVSANDVLQISKTPSGTPAATNFSAAVTQTPTVVNQTALFSANVNTTGTQMFWQVNGSAGGAAAATESSAVQSVIPEAGTFSNFYFGEQLAVPSSGFATTTLRVAGATTTVTCTYGGAGKTCSDTTHSASISADQLANFTMLSSPVYGSAGNLGIGIAFTPSNPGDFFFSEVPGTSVDNTTTIYWPLQGGNPFASEAAVREVTTDANITKLSVVLSATPAAGSSRTFTLRVNGVDTAVTCTVANPATTCTYSGFIHVNDGDILTTSDVANGTPGTRSPTISYVANSGTSWMLMWWEELLAALIHN